MTSNIDLSANAFNITTLEVMPSKTTTQRVVTSQVITSQNISPHFTKKFQRSQEQLNIQIIKKTRYSLNETSLKFLLKFAADSKFDPKNPPRRTNLTLPTYSIIARMKASIKDHRMLEDVLNLTDKQILFGDLNPLDKKSVLETQSNNVISMSLYGSDPKYILGAVKNAKLVKEVFPGWKLRMYVELHRVASSTLELLESMSVDLQYVDTSEQVPPMMWRFLVADDLSVDNFIIRDIDSLLTKRDYAAVMAWLRSNQTFHCIRDHPSHSRYSISGGLWGAKPARLKNIFKSTTWSQMMRRSSDKYFTDMDFLNTRIWPLVKHDAYCSDSVSCDVWSNSFPFPVVRYGYEHVGQVFDVRGLARFSDVRILRDWRGNSKCLSPEEIPDRVRRKEEHRLNSTNLSDEDKFFGGLVPITNISYPQYN